MCADRFHDRPFDEGTLTKLQIFQLYAREWLPVFLSKPEPIRREVRTGEVRTEADVIDVCFQHGVRRQHAETVLKALKTGRVIEIGFRVPNIDRLRNPRSIRLLRSQPHQ